MTPSAERLSLAIVAHDDVVRETIAQAAVQSEQFTICSAGLTAEIAAQSVLEMVREGDVPDVIIFETNLPESAEVLVTRQLRFMALSRRPLILFVAPCGIGVDHSSADRAGADGLFVWTPSVDDLRESVSTIADLAICAAIRE